MGFDDETTQVIDFQSILKGELYAPLKDSTLFNQVQIDQEVHTLVWPNGADFDPAILHDGRNTLRNYQIYLNSGNKKTISLFRTCPINHSPKLTWPLFLFLFSPWEMRKRGIENKGPGEYFLFFFILKRKKEGLKGKRAKK